MSVCFLTGSAGLLGHGQGDLGQREDVDFGAILGGGRGQGGGIRLVLLSLGVLELLVRGHTLQLVTGGETMAPLFVDTGTRRAHKSHTLCVSPCVRRCGDCVGAGHTGVSVPHDDTKPHIHSNFPQNLSPLMAAMHLCVYGCMHLLCDVCILYVYILNLIIDSLLFVSRRSHSPATRRSRSPLDKSFHGASCSFLLIFFFFFLLELVALNP